MSSLLNRIEYSKGFCTAKIYILQDIQEGLAVDVLTSGLWSACFTAPTTAACVGIGVGIGARTGAGACVWARPAILHLLQASQQLLLRDLTCPRRDKPTLSLSLA